MTIFQILAAIFALWMMYVVSIHGKKKTLTFGEVVFWITIWVLFVIIAIFPNLLLGIAHTLKFGRVFDLLVVGALMILNILVFASYFTQKESQRRLEDLVRQLAIAERTTKKKV
jgi:hypothetical protein